MQGNLVQGQAYRTLPSEGTVISAHKAGKLLYLIDFQVLLMDEVISINVPTQVSFYETLHLSCELLSSE